MPELRLFPEKTDDRSYLPSYDVAAGELDSPREAAIAAVRDVPGWLRPEDMLKIYELGYFADGPILEIGAYRGRSSVLTALALRDAGNDAPLFAIDVDPDALRAAGAHAAAQGVADRVVYVRGTSRAFFRAMPRYRPALVFVDGDHSLAGVHRDLAVLRRRLPNGGLLLMHDYLDERNEDPDEPEFGVTRGIAESWVATDCEFAGTFGCCGLFRRAQGGPGRADRAPVLDLVARDTPRLRYLQRVRWPIGRRLRRLGLRR